MSYFLYIRNMVNRSSFEVIDQIFKGAGLNPVEIKSGKVTLLTNPPKQVLEGLNEALLIHGFSIIDDNSEKISERIKSVLAELISNNDFNLKSNLSVYLSDKLHYEYHYLSTVFSDVEKLSIEKYFIKLKIEKAKKLITESNLTFSEIAYQLAYSSPAHFTNQFKQTEGVSPSEFKTSLIKK